MEGPLAIAQAFTEQTFHYTSQAELASGLEACTFELGFHRFANLHHVDLRRRPAAMIHIDNYPAVWSEHFIQSRLRSEEHTSELQSLMRTSYAVFCLQKKKNNDESQSIIPAQDAQILC